MRIVGVIPARYKSSRFPGKPLVKLLGIPMVIRVADIVSVALGKENTYIATDDERIQKVANEYGYKVVITSSDCLTGTDRLWDFSKQIDADIYINIQGDEPMLDPNDIIRIVNAKKNNMNFVVNGMSYLIKGEDPTNVNIPKVLVNKKDELIYMSRLPIPGNKYNSLEQYAYKKQVCIYAFTKDELELFGSSKMKSECEANEDIEILRFFDLGVKVKMVETYGFSLAVDIPEDVEKVEAELMKRDIESKN